MQHPTKQQFAELVDVAHDAFISCASPLARVREVARDEFGFTLSGADCSAIIAAMHKRFK